MTHRVTTTGPRVLRGPVGRALLVALVAATFSVPARAAGALGADCRMDRDGAQVMKIVAVAHTAPGDVALNIKVRCTVTGPHFGFSQTVENTAVGVAVVATGFPEFIGADDFEICYSAEAKLRSGETVTFAQQCYTRPQILPSPFPPTLTPAPL